MKITKQFIFILALLFAFGAAYADESYDHLRAEYDKASRSNGSRALFNNIGDRFYKVYLSAPKSANADRALLFAGKSYKESFERYSNSADMETSLKFFRTLYSNYKTEAGAEACLEAAEIYTMKKDLASAEHMLNRVRTDYPGTEQAIAATSMLADLAAMSKNGSGLYSVNAPVNTPVAPSVSEPVKKTADPVIPVPIEPVQQTDVVDNPSPNGMTLINEISHISSPDYSRIVLHMSQNAKIEEHWLKEDVKNNLPARLYIDVIDSEVRNSVPKDTTIKDGLIRSVRWAYNRPGVTRIVLDSEAVREYGYTVYQIANPARLIIDLTAKPTDVQTASRRPATNEFSTKPIDGDHTLLGVIGLKVRTVVLDPGHGGKDPGCVYAGLKEKDLVLDMALEVKKLLEANHKDIKVILTRSKDVYIPLEERTAIANAAKADLFISIHINAAKNKNAKGIETYVLNMTTDKSALETAAFENQDVSNNISSLQSILNDIALNSKLEESLILAGIVQSNIVKTVKTPTKENLGVKKAPFYVLIGAQMPSILVETGFLSNAEEAKKLGSASYKKELSKGIYRGIDAYIKKYNK